MVTSHVARDPVGTATKPATRLDSLTGLRWFAAFGVFCSHVNVLLPIPHLGPGLALGESGVTFFFILSGFVLVWTFTETDTAGRFYGRRFARIWPLLVLAVVIPTIYDLTGPLWTTTGHLLLIGLWSVLLVQAWVPGWLTTGPSPVTWSLSCEALFYAIFPAIVRPITRLPTRALVAVGVVAVAIPWGIRVWLWDAYPPTAPITPHAASMLGFFVYSPLVRLPQFLLGMVIAVLVRRGWRGLPVSLPVVLILTAFVVLGTQSGQAWRSQTLFDALDQTMMPLYGLLVAAVAMRDLSGGRSFLQSAPFVRLGNWSYAFYLFHFAVLFGIASSLNHRMPLLMYFYRPVSPSLDNLGYALLGLAIAVVFSALAYTLFEHPLERWLRRRLGTRQAVPAPAAPEPLAH